MTESNLSHYKKSFRLKGNRTGVLLIHGFTGSPLEMSRIGTYLNQKGYTVEAPLLPGHGTSPADLNSRVWQEWVNAAIKTFLRLNRECDNVFVGGLSMGSLITLEIAYHYINNVSGIILYSPPLKIADKRSFLLPIGKHILKQVPKTLDYFFDPDAEHYIDCYKVSPTQAAYELMKLLKKVKKELSSIHTPALIQYSTKDVTITSDSAKTLHDEIGSKNKRLIAYHKSSHAMTVDLEWEEIAKTTHQFIQENLQ